MARLREDHRPAIRTIGIRPHFASNGCSFSTLTTTASYRWCARRISEAAAMAKQRVAATIEAAALEVRNIDRFFAWVAVSLATHSVQHGAANGLELASLAALTAATKPTSKCPPRKNNQ